MLRSIWLNARRRLVIEISQNMLRVDLEFYRSSGASDADIIAMQIKIGSTKSLDPMAKYNQLPAQL